MFEYEMKNCLPEYFRLQKEQYEHECELEHERQEHYRANKKKLDDAKKTGYLILDYGGFDACAGCGYADFDTIRNADDDIGLIICKNPNCLEHKRHEEENN